MLKKPDFIERADGLITKIWCKICGERIAQITRNEETGGERLGRFNNYREVTIEHWLEHGRTEPDFHVTQLCSKCAGESLSAETLNELYKADLAVMERSPGAELPEAWRSRQPRRVIDIRETF